LIRFYYYPELKSCIEGGRLAKNATYNPNPCHILHISKEKYKDRY